MAENLVVVESPAKAKTIERYLGSDFKVLASYGHIRDLPRSDFAIEVDADGRGCHLVYEIPASSKKQVAALRKAAKEATTVWLAPDLDREGEAIAWHVAEALGLDPATTNRVTFDEITKPAIEAAFAAPRTLNLDLVDAQQARRAVDRIVGYRLSPVLWRTVSSGISAGRVQSVALRIIVDREEEIRAFVAQEYWSFQGRFSGGVGTDGQPVGAPEIDAKLYSVDGKRLASPKELDELRQRPGGGDDADESKLVKRLLIDNADDAEALKARLEPLSYAVREVRRTEAKRNPKAPFKTSSLQGEASKYGFSARQTMAIAQQLYEGINLGGEQVGLITYMRTDSLNLSDQALGSINDFVRERYGQAYSIDRWRRFAGTTKGAQEAHEAIRPTDVNRTPESVRGRLSGEQARLYELIWKRTVATQMAPAVFDRVSADVVGSDQEGEALWRVTGQVEKFDGWLKAYRAVRDEDEEDDEVSDRLPQLDEGQELDLRELLADQHFTSPPPRYSERTLVETLEELGIGRPSTYASIITTLENREYVLKESRRFFATPLGEVVTAFMKAHFSEIVDVNFTARMESTLDEIAQGDEQWCATVTRFLDEVDQWVKERKPERPRLPLAEEAQCHLCGAPMEKVFSGKSKQWFASCSRWPDCDGTLPLNEDGTVGEPEPEPEPDEDVRCPVCGKAMLAREGKFGTFFGCVDYPKCKGIRNLQKRAVYLDQGEWKAFRSPTDPGSYMELRKSRYGKPFLGSTGYPDDQFAIWSVPLADPCPRCGAPLRPPPKSRKVPTVICAGPELEHHFEAEDFDLPTIHTIDTVEGVDKWDPELGGEPINGWPPAYESLRLEFLKEEKPKPKATKKATRRGEGRR
ncbi:MAG TPA: type I DNA topoisomerase [Nitriliruptorales bacterium]